MPCLQSAFPTHDAWLGSTLCRRSWKTARRDFQARSTIALPHASFIVDGYSESRAAIRHLDRCFDPVLPSARSDTPASRRGDKRLSSTSNAAFATAPAIRKAREAMDACARISYLCAGDGAL
ncbi:hypothetical protein K491DRAFT_692798 [Lophiostoma macrostomum CBS 122681]|uniref:Uncharacterized protein n=1 Tax=Lophiostoma macrostomum CBS 122681 TaxID=1314788 RepID=A0A6A6T9P5_9PLEO|nr:hypothetical protein K491DRAFT_692798 [Lophiostoma macrostomum CBS 122681]